MDTGSAPAWLNTGSLVGLGALAIGLIGGFIAIAMAARSNKAKPQQQAQTSLNLLIAVVTFVFMTGGAIIAVATGTLDFLINS